MPDINAGFSPNTRCATISLDLTIDGKPVHYSERIPLDVWDGMSPDRRAEVGLHAIYQAVWQLAPQLADRLTVVRDA